MSNPWLTFRKLCGAWPRTAQEYHERAMEYASEGQHEAAIDELHTALRRSASQNNGDPIDSEGFQYLVALAEVHTELGQHEAALDALNEVQRKYGDDFGSADEQRVQCLTELGDFERALALLEAYVQGGDYGPDLNLARARCLAGLNRPGEAREAFDLAIREAEEDWGEANDDAHFHRGKFLLTMGDARLALADFQRVLEMSADEEGDGSEPKLQRLLIEACRLSAEAHQTLGDSVATDEARRRADELEKVVRNYRPKSLRQIHKAIWLAAGVELAGPMIAISIGVWWFGPAIYRLLDDPLGLPPQPKRLQAVPLTLLTLSILSMVALIVASIRNQKPQPDERIDVGVSRNSTRRD